MKMKYQTGGTKDSFIKRNMKELMNEFKVNHEDHGGDQKFYLSNKAFLNFAKNKYNKIKNRGKSKSTKKTTVKKGIEAYKTGGFLEPSIESID